MKAADANAILGCPVASYLSWIDSYLTTDRIAPGMLQHEAPFGYTLHYAPGTDLAAKALPGAEVVVYPSGPPR